MISQPRTDAAPSAPSAPSSPWRWRILALLFFATTINYLDRIVFSVLIPVIRTDLKLNDQDYGYLTGAFQIAYTAGFLAAGRFIDRFGTKIGYAASILWWSIAAALHPLARTGVELGIWRALLGLGEAGNFPAAIKAVAEWFPPRDRGFATGIFNAGTNVASMIGPPLFVWLNYAMGWRASFLLTASLGLVWLAFWQVMYRKPPAAATEESAPARMSLTEALAMPQTWGFALGKFLSDPVWWFYLYWLPPYLYDVRKFDLKQIGWALPVVYLMADFGSVAGGWLSGWLMRRGWSTQDSRRAAMGLCAFLMPVAALAVLAPGPVLTIALLSLATGAHQGWSANLYTITSDAFPKEAVATVTGIGGCVGGFGGFLFSAIIPGYVITHFGYRPIFALMGSMHVLAWVLMNRLVWKRRAV